MAKHLGPESCVMRREVYGKALEGETSRPAIEQRNREPGAPTLLCEAEVHGVNDDNRKSCFTVSAPQTPSNQRRRCV